MVKDKLKRKDNGLERSDLIRWRILHGMLWGPEDLFRDKELIVLRISAGLI